MELVADIFAGFFVAACFILGVINNKKSFFVFLLLVIVGLSGVYYYQFDLWRYAPFLFIGTFIYAFFAFFSAKTNPDKNSIVLKTKSGRNFEIKHPQDGIGVFGGSGSGKTTGIIKPILKQLIAQSYTITKETFLLWPMVMQRITRG